MDYMLMDAEFELPGGDGFKDVTNLFVEAAKDMEPGEILFSDGFTLQDAMSAFEIGEPRLDSGCVLEDERRPPFNPLVPILPEELCWILDRSFTCEMEWHAGNTLSQTVYTLLFVHHLAEINPEFMPAHRPPNNDPSRPLELITLVLRSAIFGLLKCCDLAWRELLKGGLQDGEDWQGEKCDISLLEGVTVKHVLSKLEEAGFWLSVSQKVPQQWRDALRARIALRKTILQLMNLDIYKDCPKFQALITAAREQLRVIRCHPSPEPTPDAPSYLAFDPYIGRHINSFIPLRVLVPPAQEQTWRAIDTLLDSWEELTLLYNTTNLSTWEIVGHLRAWLPDPALRIAYIRSVNQSTFFDGVLVFHKFAPVWIVDCFFTETLGVSYDALVLAVKSRWRDSEGPCFADIERRLIRLITAHIKGHWYNPPRRRRHMMNSLVDWHALYDTLLRMTAQVGSTNSDIVTHMPNAALVWILSIIREVVLSGFQLELYTAEEKAFAYWYAAQVIETHLGFLDEMVAAVPQQSTAHAEIKFQMGFLTALQLMSVAMFSVSMKLTSFAWQRMELNFMRRYKWAFRSEYDDIETPAIAQPEFLKFVPACRELLNDEFYSPSDSLKMARDILGQVAAMPVGWAGLWGRDRIQVIRNLSDVCEGLYGLPAEMKDIPAFNVSLLNWDPEKNPWFPAMTP